jgi:nucleotide-binding universal stress UspA family protein
MTQAGEAKRSVPDAILVAMDFSACALRALDVALAWKPPGGEVIVLHVVDTDLARRVERFDLCASADALARMRAQAEEKMAALVAERGGGKFETIVAEGIPFAEICKMARDLECGLVVMGKHGTAPEMKDFLFGGTAEKVLRGTRHPVLCVP